MLIREFKAILADPYLPYTKDQTAHKIKTILKEADLQQVKVKHFYDLAEGAIT